MLLILAGAGDGRSRQSEPGQVRPSVCCRPGLARPLRTQHARDGLRRISDLGPVFDRLGNFSRVSRFHAARHTRRAVIFSGVRTACLSHADSCLHSIKKSKKILASRGSFRPITSRSTRCPRQFCTCMCASPPLACLGCRRATTTTSASSSCCRSWGSPLACPRPASYSGAWRRPQLPSPKSDFWHARMVQATRPPSRSARTAAGGHCSTVARANRAGSRDPPGTTAPNLTGAAAGRVSPGERWPQPRQTGEISKTPPET